jgi:hypothetical protein
MLTDDLVIEWTSALRSGDYAQGQNVLCRVDDDGSHEYCCLGVLADILVKHGNGIWQNPLEGEQELRFQQNPDDEFIGVLPSSLIPSHAQNNVLIRMNDNQGADFDTIADKIEWLHDKNYL